jgi:hypothetical protein
MVAMSMDMSIRLGDVIQIAVIVSGLFIGYGKLETRLAVLEAKIEPLWRALERRQSDRRHPE